MIFVNSTSHVTSRRKVIPYSFIPNANLQVPMPKTAWENHAFAYGNINNHFFVKDYASLNEPILKRDYCEFVECHFKDGFHFGRGAFFGVPLSDAIGKDCLYPRFDFISSSSSISKRSRRRRRRFAESYASSGCYALSYQSQRARSTH